MYLTPGSGQGNEDGASMRGLDTNSVSFSEVHNVGITFCLAIMCMYNFLFSFFEANSSPTTSHI